MKIKLQATCKSPIKILYLYFYNIACLQKKKGKRKKAEAEGRNFQVSKMWFM